MRVHNLNALFHTPLAKCFVRFNSSTMVNGIRAQANGQIGAFCDDSSRKKSQLWNFRSQRALGQSNGLCSPGVVHSGDNCWDYLHCASYSALVSDWQVSLSGRCVAEAFRLAFKPSPPEFEGVLSVVVHVRRGDVDTYGRRGLGDRYFIQTLAFIDVFICSDTVSMEPAHIAQSHCTQPGW